MLIDTLKNLQQIYVFNLYSTLSYKLLVVGYTNVTVFGVCGHIPNKKKTLKERYLVSIRLN